jgi:hypothetical protein
VVIAARLYPDSGPVAYPVHAYRIAGCTLIIDSAIAALSPFLSHSDESLPGDLSDPVPAIDAGHMTLIRQTNAWIAGSQRAVTSWQTQSGYLLQVEGGAQYYVSRTGNSIVCVGSRASDRDLVEWGLLGPALYLALALCGIFCFHASAVAADGRAVGFLGEPGAGKSTLATYLGTSAGGVWQQIGDEVLPASLMPPGLTALPRFPQLLPAGWMGSGQPDRLPLAALYVVEPSPGSGAGVTAEPLSSRSAAASLVFHTLAASLFPGDLLARHMEFCAIVAQTIPVRRLVYPHTVGALSQAHASLAADLDLPSAR